MKTLEQVENISFDELEAVAEDLSAEVPSDLEESVQAAILSAAMMTRRRNSRTIAYALSGVIATAAASLLIIFSLPAPEPRDTFDDPALAYAKIEETLSYISAKMEKGIAMASQAAPVIEKSTEVFNK